MDGQLGRVKCNTKLIKVAADSASIDLSLGRCWLIPQQDLQAFNTAGRISTAGRIAARTRARRRR